MANQEQLEILKKSVLGWKKWKNENFEVKIDLSEVDLRSSVLDGVDLGGASLSEVHLSRAFFSQAQLSGANLWEAELIWKQAKERFEEALLD